MVTKLLVSLQMMIATLGDTRRSSDEGATAVEYGLMVSLIAVAIVITVTALGGELNTVFGNVKTAITP